MATLRINSSTLERETEWWGDLNGDFSGLLRKLGECHTAVGDIYDMIEEAELDVRGFSVTIQDDHGWCGGSSGRSRT